MKTYWFNPVELGTGRQSKVKEELQECPQKVDLNSKYIVGDHAQNELIKNYIQRIVDIDAIELTIKQLKNRRLAYELDSDSLIYDGRDYRLDGDIIYILTNLISSFMKKENEKV